MEKRARVSESEWFVMKEFWAQSPATANDIVNTLSDKAPWGPKTIKTLISRLTKKRVLGFEKQGREYQYFPLVDESECAMTETRLFLQRVYDGSLERLLSTVLKKGDLSLAEIARIKKIFDQQTRE